MTVSALRIQNFQVHEETKVRLSPKVTTIVGPTDVGKSAIVRALKWLCFNRPSGQAFLRRGKKWIRVSAKVDGKVLLREKGKGKNEYRVDKRKLKAIGTQVPRDVGDVLKVSPTINFQNQLDAPFWLSLTPGQVSKELNSVVDLGVIDRALKNVNTKLRKVKVRLSISQERLDEAKGRVRELQWVRRARHELTSIERVYNCLMEVRENRVSLQGIIENVQNDVAMRDLAGNRVLCGCALIRRGAGIVGIASKRRNLHILICEVNKCEEMLQKLEQQQVRVKRKLSQVKECPLCNQPIKS